MKIFYLRPKSGLKTLLRSDTLWGNICWAIRMVYGEAVLVDYINNLDFKISSAFPYSRVDGVYTPYFPIPLLGSAVRSAPAGATFDELSIWMTEQKQKKKQSKFIPKDLFEQLINGEVFEDDLETKKSTPGIKSETVTRNKIDRLKGGTFKGEGEAGQLFHVDEFHVAGGADGTEYGLFFLADGNTELLEGAVRLLQHIGIGGDRNVGKGVFEVHFEDFNLKTPQQSNAVTTLSLYAPTETELHYFANNDVELCNYQVEVREGKLGFLNFTNVMKNSLLYFKEGSTFPRIENCSDYGQNQIASTITKLDYQVVQYGKGFMIAMLAKANN